MPKQSLHSTPDEPSSNKHFTLEPILPLRKTSSEKSELCFVLVSYDMHLEDLVPELLAHILQALDHPRDLLSLVRASPHCFRVYAQSPALILSSVLKNAISPDALHHALTCGLVPSTASRTVREAFIGDYFQPKPLPFPTDKKTITALAGFFLRTSYFVDDYSTRAMRALNPEPGAEQATAPALSSTERARLQRAFFRYELYCRVFPIDNHDINFSLVPARQQFTQFLARMAPFEAEEMTCVHHYFTVLIGGVMDDLEDQLVEAVLTAPGVCYSPVLARSSSPEPAKRRKIAGSTKMVYFENLELRDLDLFSNDNRYRWSSFVSYVASLGSKFAYRLVLANKDQRRRMIQENTPVWRDFLPEALDCAPITGPKVTMPDGINDNHLSHPNLGYFRFKRSKREVYFGILQEDILNSPLRERAYVFWDADRILCPMVSEQLQKARNMDPVKVNLQFYRYKGKSAEERLEGVKIPWVQMQKISEKFGSVFDSW